MQSEIIGVEVKAVKSYGIVWIIKGYELFKTDDQGTSFERFDAGVKFHMATWDKLNNLKPIPESERLTILSKLLNNVKELM